MKSSMIHVPLKNEMHKPDDLLATKLSQSITQESLVLQHVTSHQMDKQNLMIYKKANNSNFKVKFQ